MKVANKIWTGIVALVLLLPSLAAYAKEYGSYDPKRLLLISETPTGKQHDLDMRYLDRWLHDLSLHAKDYPALFDTPLDRQRATEDARWLSGMLDTVITGPTPNPQLLARAAFINSLGHNLDISGLGEKADSQFQKLLAAVPADARANYMYGTFLVSVGKPKNAIPYLEKAIAVGVVDANYTLGMTYMTLGEKQKALEYLEAYKRRNPNDEIVDKLLDAIRNDAVTRKVVSP